MFQTYEESNCNTPFFFVLFPGTDPTPIVEAVAASVGCTEKNGQLMNISMGQGQETVALNALNKLAASGGWVMLQNIHLMQEWLPKLERALEVIEDFAVPEFRCVLTSEPPGLMQGRLVGQSWTVVEGSSVCFHVGLGMVTLHAGQNTEQFAYTNASRGLVLT